MNDEAFARRFYADRAELESLGIHLKVDKPAEGYYEAENYSLPPENFYLPAIEFTDEELGALRMALSLLDGEFAYAEPLRLALQQLSWGKPSPLDAPEERSVALAVTAGGGRARAVAAPVEGRDRDLPAQDDRLRLLHDRPRRRGDAQGRPLPPALQGRAVLPDRPLARARRRARVPRLAHPRQGRLLVQGRARLQPARGVRPARLRDPHRLAARRPDRARAHLAVGPHRLARAAPLRPRRRGHRGRRRRDLRDRLRQRAPDGRPGCWASASTRASRARPSWSRSGASASSWSSSATPSRRSWPRQVERRRSRRSRTTRTARARRSARSASPGWSRSRAS